MIVVDDGSTDETAEIAGGHPGVRLVRIPHGGLSVARNEGFRAASRRARRVPRRRCVSDSGVAVLPGARASTLATSAAPADRTCRPPTIRRGPMSSPARRADRSTSWSPTTGPSTCRAATWRSGSWCLSEVGGFDPVYEAAGDDVDFCWKALDARLEDRLSSRRRRLAPPSPGPARLPAPAAQLRAQRGPGRGPPPTKLHRRWDGAMAGADLQLADHVDRAASGSTEGSYGTAAYQSVYRAGGHLLDLAHQVGMPIAALTLLTAPLAVSPPVACGAGLGRPCLPCRSRGYRHRRARSPPRRSGAGRAPVPSAGRRSPPAPATGAVAGAQPPSNRGPSHVSIRIRPASTRGSAPAWRGGRRP